MVVVVEEGLGLGESMKSPFSVLHGAQSIVHSPQRGKALISFTGRSRKHGVKWSILIQTMNS